MVISEHGTAVVLELVFVPFDCAFTPFIFEKLNERSYYFVFSNELFTYHANYSNKYSQYFPQHFLFS
jgi:hypothetical protein